MDCVGTSASTSDVVGDARILHLQGWWLISIFRQRAWNSTTSLSRPRPNANCCCLAVGKDKGQFSRLRQPLFLEHLFEKTENMMVDHSSSTNGDKSRYLERSSPAQESSWAIPFPSLNSFMFLDREFVDRLCALTRCLSLFPPCFSRFSVLPLRKINAIFFLWISLHFLCTPWSLIR